MFRLRPFVPVGILPIGLVTTCLMLTGCEKSGQITSYSAKKHESLQTTKFQTEFERLHPKPNRMIVVMIPQPQFHWFFKLEGDPVSVAARENEVREFVKSIHFPSPVDVEWTLPAGWKKLPGNEMRYATLQLDGEPGLEMSVSKFPVQPDSSLESQVVLNVNRWRNQLSLPPIDDEDLAIRSEKLPLNGFVGYWINIVGRPRPKPAPVNAPRRQAAPQDEKVEEESAGPMYVKPEGWTEAASNGVAAVSLQAVEGESKVVITVTSAKGSRLDNVNRWRGQLQLEPIGEDELEKSAKKVDVGQLSGDLFKIVNEERTIVGVIVESREQTWFIKLTGNSALAEKERGRFEAFLKSLRL